MIKTRTTLTILLIIAIVVGAFAVLKPREQTLEVQVPSINLFQMDFQKDWDDIRARSGLEDGARLENFDLEYNSDGTIRDCTYTLYGYTEEGTTISAAVQLLPNKKLYSIRPIKVDQKPLQYDRLVSANRFFNILSSMNLQAVKPLGKYEWYAIDSNGEFGSFSSPIQPSRMSFLLQPNGLPHAIASSSFPFKGYWILSQGIIKVGETYQQGTKTVHYEGKNASFYYFDIQND